MRKLLSRMVEGPSLILTPFQLLRVYSLHLYWPSRKSGVYAVEQLVKALLYKLEGRGFD